MTARWGVIERRSGATDGGEGGERERKEAPATSETQNAEGASLLVRSRAIEGQHDLAARGYYKTDPGAFVSQREGKMFRKFIFSGQRR